MSDQKSNPFNDDLISEASPPRPNHGEQEPLALDTDEEEPLVLQEEPEAEEDEPISLVDEEEAGSDSVRAFGSAAVAGKHAEKQFKRPLNLTGKGATRCRLFHSKIAQAPLEHMQEAINEWLDSEECEVKHVGHMIGTLEGKRPEPNIFVMVWY
jgi:hypothetical protein